MATDGFIRNVFNLDYVLSKKQFDIYSIIWTLMEFQPEEEEEDYKEDNILIKDQTICGM